MAATSDVFAESGQWAGYVKLSTIRPEMYGWTGIMDEELASDADLNRQIII